MASREERKAKKEEGLCLHEGCGSKAVMPPVFVYCEKHRDEEPRFHARRGPRKKRPASN